MMDYMPTSIYWILTNFSSIAHVGLIFNLSACEDSPYNNTTKVAYFKKVIGELDPTIQCLPTFLSISVAGCKFFTLSLNSNAFLDSFHRIREDWKTYGDSFASKTMYKYAARGYDGAVFYTVYLYSSVVLFISLPVMPAILDVIMPLNETRNRPPIFDTDYGVDPNDYYVLITIHAIVTTIQVVQCLLVIDTVALLLVEHCCGMFQIVELILDRLKDETQEGFENFQYATVCQAIDTHKRAIEFAKLINSTFSNMYAYVVIINMVIISLTGVETVMKLDDKKYDQVLRFGIFTIGQMLHLFFNSIPGQDLYNHSEQTFNIIYNSNWSSLSQRCKKLIAIMLMRCIKPSTISAGGFYMMNMENFGSVIQTSMSYLTVLSSVR